MAVLYGPPISGDTSDTGHAANTNRSSKPVWGRALLRLADLARRQMPLPLDDEGQANAAFPRRVFTTAERVIAIRMVWRAVVANVKDERVFLLAQRANFVQHQPHRVVQMREDFQQLMADRYVTTIKELTGRNVVAFLSQAHVDPDITIEIFFVDGPLPGFGAIEVIEPE